MKKKPALLISILLIALAGAALLVWKTWQDAAKPSINSTSMTTPVKVDREALEKAAQQGDAEAQYKLGQALTTGNGGAPDFRKAAKWLQMAADQGHAGAQVQLAELYEAGRGVQKDYAKAMELYQKAAEKGSPEAQYGLADMYEFGRGTAKDQKQAALWFAKAAETGMGLAQFNLGQRYHLGVGLAKDDTQAYKWLLLAKQNQISDADKFLSELEETLSKDNIAAAKKLAMEFKPRK